MLVDTSVLIRTLQPHHSLYTVADDAIRILPTQGKELHIAPQNLIELWAVATRPFGENGLGMNADQAAAELERIKGIFVFLPEMAAMRAHGIKDILTFDRTGFTRYAGIEVVHPADVISAAN